MIINIKIVILFRNKFKELNVISSTKKMARGGFTLIEILVVLVIMGFLVALVAPKLAGVVDGAVKTTNDTGLQRFSDAMNSYLTKKASIPPALTNLVSVGGVMPDGSDYVANSGKIVATADYNEANGVEALSEEFSTRMLPMTHFLNVAEAKELKTLIGAAVMNLEARDPADSNKSVSYVRRAVATNGTNLPVMMIGAGYNEAGTLEFAEGATVTVTQSTVTVDETVTEAIAPAAAPILASGSAIAPAAKVYTRIGEAKNVLRIVMGVSNRNMLVVKGYLDESGVSASQKNAENDFTYGGYSLILPRLQATLDRFQADGTNGITQTATLGAGGAGGATTATDPITFQAIKYDELDDGSFEISARTPWNPSLLGGQLEGQTVRHTTSVDPMGHVIGERGGWFGVKLTRGKGTDIEGDL